MSIGAITEPIQLVYNRVGVTIGMVHYMVPPFAVLLLYANLTDIDRRVVQAARFAGRPADDRLLPAWPPMSLPGIAVATLFILVFSLGFSSRRLCSAADAR